MSDLFSREWFNKLLAIIFAIALWIYVVNSQNPVREVVFTDIPIQVEGAEGMKLTRTRGPEPAAASVKVRGRQNVLSRLTPRDFTAVINIKSGAEGDNNFDVSLTAPRNVEIVEYSPKSVLVRLESSIEKQVAVELSTKGQLPAGRKLLTAAIEPAEVRVVGPRMAVDGVKRIVAVLDLTGVTDSVERSLPLRALDAEGNEVAQVQIRPETVKVRVPVIPVKAVSIKPTITGTPPEGYLVVSATALPSTVDITGDPDDLKNITEIATQPIDVTGYRSDFTKEVFLAMPEHVSAVDQTVAVSVRVVIHEKTAEKTLKGPIKISGLEPNLTAELSEGEGTITVSGPYSKMQNLTWDDLHVSVDATGFPEGTHRFTVRYRLPEGVRAVSVSPESVYATITQR